MAKRKNLRSLTRRVQLAGRLGALWPHEIQGRWPGLPSETLWYILYSGLRHLNGRDPELAEQWIGVLERALPLERERAAHDPPSSLYGASILSATTRPKLETERELHSVLTGWAVKDLRRGKQKKGADWSAWATKDELLTNTFTAFAKIEPPRVATAWWAKNVNILLRVVLGVPRVLTPAEVTRFLMRHRRPRQRARYLLALAGAATDPKYVNRNLAPSRRRRA